jgi:hypothetical protein
MFCHIFDTRCFSTFYFLLCLFYKTFINIILYPFMYSLLYCIQISGLILLERGVPPKVR